MSARHRISRTIEFDPALLLTVTIYDKPDDAISPPTDSQALLLFEKATRELMEDKGSESSKEWCG
jgi:hypothetical protein